MDLPLYIIIIATFYMALFKPESVPKRFALLPVVTLGLKGFGYFFKMSIDSH